MYKSLLIAASVLILIGGIIYFRQNGAWPQNIEMKNSQMLEKKEGGMEVAAEEVEYFAGTKGYFVYPVSRMADNGTRPAHTGHYTAGVIMIHEWWGLNDNIKDMAHELAKEGYLVFAVDLYKGKVAATREDAQKYRTELDTEEAVANMRAATAHLRSRGAEKIASLGWCFGGGKSLELALSGEKLDATVIYYGQLVTEKSVLQKIKWPVLGIFGGKDTSIPVETVNMFRDALSSLSIQNSVYIYPGVGHAFANPSGANFAPEETKDAWLKTLAFLAVNLKGMPSGGSHSPPIYSDE